MADVVFAVALLSHELLRVLGAVGDAGSGLGRTVVSLVSTRHRSSGDAWTGVAAVAGVVMGRVNGAAGAGSMGVMRLLGGYGRAAHRQSEPLTTSMRRA